VYTGRRSNGRLRGGRGRAMLNDWRFWLAAAILSMATLVLALSIMNVRLVSGPFHLDRNRIVGPISRACEIAGLLAVICMSTASLAIFASIRGGISVPWAVIFPFLVIGIILTWLSVLVRSAGDWSFSHREQLPSPLRRLAEQEQSAQIRRINELLARREAHRQARTARRQA
jgi:hypothetical protein